MGAKKLPTSVKIGPYTYAVRVEPGAFPNDHNDRILCGESDHNACVIRVMERDPDQMVVTFWHEVLHAIDDLAGTELTEDVINRIAPLLVMVLRENAGLGTR